MLVFFIWTLLYQAAFFHCLCFHHLSLGLRFLYFLVGFMDVCRIWGLWAL